MIYYLFFVLSVLYFITLFRPYRDIIRAGNVRLLLTEALTTVLLDLFILVAALANVAMGAREYLGLNTEHLSSLAIWFSFAAVAVHRLTEEIDSIKARMATKGEQA